MRNNVECVVIETPEVSGGYDVTTRVLSLKIGELVIPLRAFGANSTREPLDSFSDWQELALKFAASQDMYEALKYCYDHIRDAANSGVDISSFYGEMEWRTREALQKANGGELE